MLMKSFNFFGFFISMLVIALTWNSVRAEDWPENSESSSIANKRMENYKQFVLSAGLFSSSIFLHNLKRGHDFTGSSLAEIMVTTGGLVGAGMMGSAATEIVSDIIRNAALYEEELDQNSWLMTYAPQEGVALMALLISYSTHDRTFELRRMTRSHGASLYTGAVAVGLTIDNLGEVISEVISEVIGDQFTVFQQSSPELKQVATTASAMIVSLSMLAVASIKRVTSLPADFKKYPSLLTALTIGHTAKSTGRMMMAIVHYTGSESSISKQASSYLETGLTGAGLAGIASVITILTYQKDYTDVRGYRGKLLGDVTKNLGVITGAYIVQEIVVSQTGRVISTVQSMAEMTLNEPVSEQIIDTISDNAWPAVRFLPSVVIISVAPYVGNLIVGERTFDLRFGVMAGGFVFLVKDAVQALDEMDITGWAANAVVLAGLFTYNYLKLSGLGTKQD